MAIDILMHLCILKFINLAPCLFVIFLTEFGRRRSAARSCACSGTERPLAEECVIPKRFPWNSFYPCLWLFTAKVCSFGLV